MRTAWFVLDAFCVVLLSIVVMAVALVLLAPAVAYAMLSLAWGLARLWVGGAMDCGQVVFEWAWNRWSYKGSKDAASGCGHYGGSGDDW